MAKFIQTFKQKGDISFTGMRNAALSLLPHDKADCNKLYEELERGTGILEDEAQLNMYLRSFGKMHKAKLEEAFQCLPQLTKLFAENVEIYDWGCGQGIATICLLDYLQTQNVQPQIGCIHLIDPSAAAVKRASDVIACFNPNFPIKKTIKLFDNLAWDDFAKSNAKKLHLFSNILDVKAFNLAKFIHLFQQSFQGKNFFICVGPYYSNNHRVDEFIVATNPDITFANVDKESGAWKDAWTISMRVFFKNFQHIESIENIGKRIEESQKKEQFFAGYVLDAISEEYQNTDIAQETEELYKALSVFDVKSNIAFDYNKKCNPKLAVIANIISRGLPTKAPILLENIFCEKFKISTKPQEDALLNYTSTHHLSASTINEALHIIDPRFKIESYNEDALESSFEKAFIKHNLQKTRNEYIIQILEPQRLLSSIVSIPDKQFCKDQRVDFAFEIPYGESHTGFILELDGKPFHSNIFQRLHDARRDKMSSQNGWNTYRIEEVQEDSFLKNWEGNKAANKYLAILKKNHAKELTNSWNEALQIVLSPLAIARIERMVVEAMMNGALQTSKEQLDIIIIERDVPCAAIAAKDLQEKYTHICNLAGSTDKMPQINLCIVSTKEFQDSPLHIGHKVLTNIPQGHFDLCIDVSMLLRDNIDALPPNVNAKTIYIIRSSHYKKKERAICSAENIQYLPLVEKDKTGSYKNIKGREGILEYFLRDIFRKPSFRPGQLPILSHALSGKTTIGLLPTGGGKSLTYQLSCILQPGVAIVVAPLVSLMVDQIRSLRDIRIDACDCVNSGMNSEDKTKKLNLLQKGAVLFMLISPERFMIENFRESLIAMTRKNNIFFSYGVIDEVHCVSEWGHDFRTSYLHLGRNMTDFMHTKSGNPLPIIGLTATASFDVLADVERELTLGGKLSIDSEAIVRPESDSRPELTYRIIRIHSNFNKLRNPNEPYLLQTESEWELQRIVAEAKKQKLHDLLQEIPSDLESINRCDEEEKHCHIENLSISTFYAPDQKGKYNNAGIIFCPHAHGMLGVLNSQHMNGLSTSFNKGNIKIGTFIGGDKPSGDMAAFNNNDLNLMVATKAFGMGIDKPNVRFTININHPSSIESFVQEAGRAGRDKKHAISYILYDPTKYIHLTADKTNDIRAQMINFGNDPQWIEYYVNKFILYDDFPVLCQKHNATNEQISNMLNIIQPYIENVDKNVILWFHNNSFRGAYKEKIILLEMTDRILNAKSTFLLEVQNKLREIIGNEDIKLKISSNKEAIAIISEEDNRKKYGYIFLNTLYPTYKYIDFELSTCQHISTSLIEILKRYKDHSAKNLLAPIKNQNDITEGIYEAMKKAGKNGYAIVSVSWENYIQQDIDGFISSIKNKITDIASSQGWHDIDAKKYGEFNLNQINDFDTLIAKIAKYSGDSRWLRSHANIKIYESLKRAFYEKRDKDDTDKAIYRMCCIGLVEDVTIDYLSQTYELKIRNRTNEEFKQYMLDFFRKYYSQEQAEIKVNEIEKRKGRNYLDKCLGCLTEFVYKNLEKKRYRAIEDIRMACEESINNRPQSANDKWLKEFIHLYFNSKYARIGYQIEINGTNRPYSLTEDTDQNSREDFDIVKKYIEAMTIDNSGSEVDNVKHLYGATLLCLRAHPNNAALQLLLTYCITFLGVGENETLKMNAFNGFIDGFMKLSEAKEPDFWKHINTFLEWIKNKIHDEDKFIQENILQKGEKTIMLLVHAKELDNIAKRYLKE